MCMCCNLATYTVTVCVDYRLVHLLGLSITYRIPNREQHPRACGCAIQLAPPAHARHTHDTSHFTARSSAMEPTVYLPMVAEEGEPATCTAQDQSLHA